MILQGEEKSNGGLFHGFHKCDSREHTRTVVCLPATDILSNNESIRKSTPTNTHTESDKKLDEAGSQHFIAFAALQNNRNWDWVK